MTAAVLRQHNGPYNLEQIELDDPQDYEILVKVAGSGICHTDAFVASYMFGRPNYILGHEGAGIVEKVGAKVTKFAPGDHVVGTFYSCGCCPTCKRGKPTYCLAGAKYNYSGRRGDMTFTTHKGNEEIYSAFFSQSSFATYMLTNEANTVKIREDVPIEIMGPLGCGVQTGAGAVINMLRPKVGSSIVVFGIGGVGLSAIMAAKLVGCSTIIAVGRRSDRLNLAKEVGATHIINSSEVEDPVAAIYEILPLGSDYAVDTSGKAPIARQAILSTNVRYGEVALIAVSNEPLDIPYDSIRMGRTVRGCMEGDAISDQFIPTLVDFYKEGRFPFDKMIKKYNLADIDQAFADMESGVTIKAVLIP